MAHREDDWPPPEARFQGSLYFGESHLRGREYLKAVQFFQRAAESSSAGERELARGLVHLAAAGYRGQLGDRRSRSHQLAHARRRLGPYLPSAYQLDLGELIALVEQERP